MRDAHDEINFLLFHILILIATSDDEDTGISVV